VLPDGQEGIRNDVSQLRKIRHKVIIAEKPSSPSENAADIQTLSQHLQIMPAESAASRALIVLSIGQKLDQYSPEIKKKLMEVGEVEVDVALTALRLNKAKMLMEMRQIESALAQAQAGPSGMPGQDPNMALPPQTGGAPEAPPAIQSESSGNMPDEAMSSIGTNPSSPMNQPIPEGVTQ